MDFCQHKNKIKEVCLDCGSIHCSIKPIRYNYLVEINPTLFFKEMKKENAKFNKLKSKKRYIQRRSQLIKFINHLIIKLKFRSQTFYLSIYCLDMIVLKTSYFDDILDLLVVGVVLVVSKFDENDSYIPNLSYFKGLSFQNLIITSSLDEIRNIELKCLKVLDYHIDHMTPYHFLNYFCAHGFVFPEENSYKLNRNSFIKFSEKVYEISKDILYSLIDCEICLEFNSLQIACACVSVGRDSNMLKNPWHSKLEAYYKIEFSEFKDCFMDLKKHYQKKNKLDDNYLNIPSKVNKIEFEKQNLPLEKNKNRLQPIILNSEKEELKDFNDPKPSKLLQSERNQIDINYIQNNRIYFTNEDDVKCNNLFSDSRKLFEIFPNEDILKKNYSAKNKLTTNSSKNISNLVINNFQKPIMINNSKKLNEIDSQNKIRNLFSRESNNIHIKRDFSNTKNMKNNYNLDKILNIYSVNKDNTRFLNQQSSNLKEMPFVNHKLYIGFAKK